jgi:hypothetical protein
MFQRQAFGYVNPFQTWAGGINPFLQHAGLSPFQQFTSGISPLLQQQIPWQIPGFISPYQQLAGGISPFHAISTGFNPWLSQAAGGAQPGAAFGIGSQPPFATPGFGVPPVVTGLGVSPLAAQCGYGAGAMNPYGGHIGALSGINPQSVDPTVALMLAQQQNPVWQQVPIRSLVGQNPLEQFQGIAGNPILGPVVDPYTALINAQLVAQLVSHLATNPIQQLIRSQVGAPYGLGAAPFPVGNPMSSSGI